MQKIIWIFQDAGKFGFVIPNDKTTEKSDFFIAWPNIWWAENWDLVEVEVLEKSNWKNKEARIVSIVKKVTENKSDESNIIWTFAQAENWEFGFVDVEWKDKWYYVFPANKAWAFNWDLVEAKVKIFNWRPEAEIVRIIERKKNLIVWSYTIWKGNYWFVIPKDKRIKNDVFVATTNALWAHEWDVVWVEITKWSKKNPEWVIKEIIASKWNMDKREEEILTLAVEWWARITFWDDVQEQLSKISSEVNSDDFQDRTNLRDLFTFTIDWADAKDLDDAISLETMENWDYKLYVHIADVSNYVTEDSALDKEALERGTSIYLADRVIPMLPEKLSNNLCSLNPYTAKMTLTCEMHIWWKTGHLIKQKVYESVIESDFRLTYKDVDEIEKRRLNVWDELMFRAEVTKELLDTIYSCNDLKDIILTHRDKSGVLNFDFPETVVEFDKDWEPIWIKEYPKYNSNKLIEVFMVSANEAVAKEFSNFPFLYRIHEQPKEFDIMELEKKLDLFGVKYRFRKWTTSEFAELLTQIEELENSKKMFLERMILRTLTQANYSNINFGHFWLWLDFYSHFTSPIRRYPDLQIHRIIKQFIHEKLDNKKQEYYKSHLAKVAKQSSERERLSEKLEYKVRDYFIVKYYKDKVWEEYDAVISGMINKWFFVTLPDSAEWFVELQWSAFDEQMQTHRDRNGNKFMLWEDIRVRLIEADETLLRLNFEVVEKLDK